MYASVAATVAATGGALKQSQYQYNGGLVTYLQVVVTENTALSARLSASDIQIRRLNATVLLIKALGGSWDALPGPPSSNAAAGGLSRWLAADAPVAGRNGRAAAAGACADDAGERDTVGAQRVPHAGGQRDADTKGVGYCARGVWGGCLMGEIRQTAHLRIGPQ